MAAAEAEGVGEEEVKKGRRCRRNDMPNADRTTDNIGIGGPTDRKREREEREKEGCFLRLSVGRSVA